MIMVASGVGGRKGTPARTSPEFVSHSREAVTLRGTVTLYSCCLCPVSKQIRARAASNSGEAQQIVLHRYIQPCGLVDKDSP